MLTIKIPSEGMSLNQCYPTNKQGRRFLTPRGKEFKELVFHATRKALVKSPMAIDPEKHYLTMELFFYSAKLLTKAGKINKNKTDLSNKVKLLEDSIFEALGVDDYLNLGFEGIHTFYAPEPMIIAMVRKHSLSDKLTPLTPPETLLQ